MLVAVSGNTDIVRVLLKEGAKIDRKDKVGGLCKIAYIG